MTQSPEAIGSELSVKEQRKSAQKALEARADDLGAANFRERALQNLSVVEAILQIPQVNDYLERFGRRVTILRVNGIRGDTRSRFSIFTQSSGITFREEARYPEDVRWSGIDADYDRKVTSEDFPENQEFVLRKLSELSTGDIVRKFQRALSRRPS